MFDKATGQAFEERIVHIKIPNDDRNWHQKIPTTLCQRYPYSQTPAYKKYCEVVEQNRSPEAVKGSRKLLHVTISVMIRNLPFLPSSSLKRISPHLLAEVARAIQERITELGPSGCIPQDVFDLLPLSAVEGMWKAINQREQLNLDTWKKISKRLLSEEFGAVKVLGLRRYRQAIQWPGPDLSIYTMPVISVSYDFITSLTLAASFSMRDLVNLADVVNLGVLQIYRFSKSVDEPRFENIVPDRLLRAWARLAIDKGAFSVLRVLKFNFVEGGLTNDSLKHFNSFPALGLVYPGLHGITKDVCDKATELGWQALQDETHIMGPHRFMSYKVRQLADDNHRDNLEWHASVRNYGDKNPTFWDGCDVTKLPSEDKNEFLAALKTVEVPTNGLLRTKLDQDLRERKFPCNDTVQGEAWERADWGLFRESLYQPRPNIGTDWDIHCLDEFNSFTYLRLDSDLHDAGVKECGVGIASIGSTFKSVISTAPIVSILIGPDEADKRKPIVFDSLTRPWFFLRANVSSRAIDPRKRASNPAKASLSMAAASSNKREGSSSVRTKRFSKVQKFEDFFGAF